MEVLVKLCLVLNVCLPSAADPVSLLLLPVSTLPSHPPSSSSLSLCVTNTLCCPYIQFCSFKLISLLNSDDLAYEDICWHQDAWQQQLCWFL